MKQVICPAPGCQDRRINWTHQEEPRGPQSIEVDDTWSPDDFPIFCSITCAMLAGAMSARNPQPMFWKSFLKMYETQGAHFHGEGDPPDLILEVRPSAESQDWLVEFRPQGHPDTDKVRNGMCWEMLHQLRKRNHDKD